MRRFLAAGTAVGALVGMLGVPTAASAAPKTAQVSAALVGVNEVEPSGRLGVGDPDGSGRATITLQRGNRLCASLTVTGVAQATAAHIHEGAAHRNGPVVVPLKAPATGSSDGCVKVRRELWNNLAEDPGGFYVNVHNAEYPDGAVRGQLFLGAPSSAPVQYEPAFNPACRYSPATVAANAPYHVTPVPSEQRGLVARLEGGRHYSFDAFTEGPDPTKPGATGRWYNFGGDYTPGALARGWIWSGYVTDAAVSAACAVPTPPALQPHPVSVPRPACWFTGTTRERAVGMLAPFSNHPGGVGHLPAGTRVTFTGVMSHYPGSPNRVFALGGDPNQYTPGYLGEGAVTLDAPVPAACAG